MNSNDNQSENKKKMSREERFAAIFGEDANLANGGDDVSLESANAKAPVIEPTHETVIVDGDEYDFEIEPATENEVTETGTVKMVNTKELKKGMTVRILDHTWYDFHTPTIGTLVNPVERPYQGKRVATVHAVYVDRMEDEHGNPVNQYTIETTEGMFKPEHLEIVE